MVYVICARCNVTTYSADLHRSVEHCPRCGQPTLPSSEQDAQASVTPIAVHPRFRAMSSPEAGPAPAS